MRWLVLLPICLFMEALGFILAPILPLFAREGYLPQWLKWFETVDCNLYGDKGWREEWVSDPTSYFSQVRWLIRNNAYGFKWSVLAAPVSWFDIHYDGNPNINRNNGGIFGKLTATMGDYWQWKLVKPIGNTGYCWMLNFGWLLDAYITDMTLSDREPKALFMFSPRIVKIKS